MLEELSPRDDMLLVDARLSDVATTPLAEHDLQNQMSIREAVLEVFDVTSEDFPPEGDLVAVFTGRLRGDSETAYDQLDTRLAGMNHFPVFREQGDQHVINVFRGRIPTPRPRPWWPNAVLFVLTLFSLLYTGAGIALGEALLDAPGRQLSELWRGWPYALALSLILGAHELGHYFAARRHHVAVTLPYFIPLPFGFFGTLGAFIQLRSPMRSRKALLDVGVAGPLAGLMVALPVLFIGLLTASVQTLPTDMPYIVEGNSLFYALSKLLVFGRFLPDGRADIFLNQLTQAGWTGLFVTGLNLIPVGQLDGGHVLYTLLGERARRLYLPAMAVMILLAVFVSDAWFLWVFLLMLFGRFYAAPLDGITPLGKRRRMVALLVLVIFILVFVPNPLRIVEPATLPVELY